VMLLGPNGAGKSTTMRILAGYVAPDQGTALIGQFDVQTQRLQAAAELGYLPENGPLYPDMTPFELLQFLGRARRLERTRLAARIAEMVERCQLGEILERPIGKLSKGQRQRVGLAHALLHDPSVLIMDEPTAGLDPNQIRQFRELIRELRGRKTFLISTHLLQEVEAVADRVLLIHAGSLHFDGTPAELGDNGSLEDRFYHLTQEPVFPR
jgi:ABC-2 type transport system ATP-binding protein